jgi:hypothetical protein
MKNKWNTGGTMKRIHIIAFLTTCLIFSFLLSGCGGDGPGPPGTEGSEKTGVDIRILSITNSDPNGDLGDVWTIDFVQQICPNGDLEVFGDNFANFTFFGEPLYTTEPNPNILYITNYRVTFNRLNPTYPPIDQIYAGAQGAARISANNQTGPFPFLILDTGRKERLYEDIIDGPYVPSALPLLYDMTIEMWGQDMYGQDFKAPVVIRQILLNNYDNC